MNDVSNNKKFLRNNFIELKILQFYFNGNKDKADKIYKLSHRLTNEGFEKYILTALNKLYGVNIDHTGKQKNGDGGIDGIDKENYIYLQCKKYHRNIDYKGKVSVIDIRSFIGGIITEQFERIGEVKLGNSLGIFVTTGLFTEAAKKTAEKCGILFIDYSNLSSEIIDKFSIDDFEKIFSSNKYDSLYKKFQQNLLEYSNIEEIPNEDLTTYFKSVREYLCLDIRKNDSENGYIFNNNDLFTFLERYKRGNKDFSIFQSKKIQKRMEFAMNILTKN